jgi:hypothetical protein
MLRPPGRERVRTDKVRPRGRTSRPARLPPSLPSPSLPPLLSPRPRGRKKLLLFIFIFLEVVSRLEIQFSIFGFRFSILKILKIPELPELPQLRGLRGRSREKKKVFLA